jgi:hypothetical protein
VIEERVEGQAEPKDGEGLELASTALVFGAQSLTRGDIVNRWQRPVKE